MYVFVIKIVLSRKSIFWIWVYVFLLVRMVVCLGYLGGGGRGQDCEHLGPVS